MIYFEANSRVVDQNETEFITYDPSSVRDMGSDQSSVLSEPVWFSRHYDISLVQIWSSTHPNEICICTPQNTPVCPLVL